MTLLDPHRHDLVLLEQDKERVLEAFRAGEFDAVEVVSEVAERNFFAFLRDQKLLQELGQSYPTPRVKEEVSTEDSSEDPATAPRPV